MYYSLQIIIILLMIQDLPGYKIDFGIRSGGENWMIVNDGVMGGRSRSSITLTENSMVFKGTLSLENNGGFASVRSSTQRIDLSEFSIVKIRYRSSGRTFALRFAISDKYYEPSFKHFFTSTAGDWEIGVFHLSDFKEHRMGKLTGNLMKPDDLKSILRLGFIINDKKEGPFELEIDYIEFY